MDIHIGRVIIVYLDNCCYSRLFDINAQDKVKAEAARIRYIIRNRFSGRYIIIGSGIVTNEMGKIRDAKRRKVTEQIYNKAIISKVALSAQTIARARELESKGLGAMDARHLATAEAGMADYLLTTDIDFIKKCAKPNLTTVKVINPLNF